MTKTAVRASVVIGVVAALTFGAASPAAAAGHPLPEGDALYAFSCESDAPVMLEVDPLTGESTGVVPYMYQLCPYNAAYDIATQTVYFNNYPRRIATADAATGEVTLGPELTFEGVPTSVDSIAIGEAREAYAFSYGQLYALDLDTGELTALAEFPEFRTFSFSYDPVTRSFYVLLAGGALLRVDLVDLTLEPVGTVPLTRNNTYGLTFDSSGRLWYVDSAVNPTVLFSASFDDLDHPVESGVLREAEDERPYYSFSLVVTWAQSPAPGPTPAQLPATGAESGPLLVGGAAALGMLLAGTVAVAVVRRRRA